MALVLLRAFYETDDSQIVHDFVQRVSGLLAAAGYSIGNTKVKKYWKIPAYMEVAVEFRTSGDQQGIDGAMSTLGAGWSRQRQDEAIWNPNGGATFIDESVRWAHLEVVG